MTFLPIVDRELRVASRRRATYLVRSLAALITIVIGSWLFLMMHRESPRNQAMALFALLSGTAVFYCLVSGVRSTADCLSREKREGTLGLLFLTDLKGYDVILGKLLANSVSVLYGVLAIVPMLGIPLLFGGITGGEVARMALVTLNTLFWSLGIGMCVSSMSMSARKASGMTFLVIVVLAGLFPATAAWLEYSGKLLGLVRPLRLMSPGYVFVHAFDLQYRGLARPFWLSLGVIHITGWVALGMASIISKRTWHDRPAGAQELKWRQRLMAWSYGQRSERTAFRKRLLDANAFFWLAARGRLGPALVWAVLGLLGCAWLWGALKWPRDWFNEGIYVTTAVILNVLIKGWFASEVSRQLAEDRQNGTLELLLSTPLRVKDIVSGQRLALERQFLGPVVLVLVIDFILMVATRSQVIANSDADRRAWLFFWFAAMGMMLVDLVALFWVGLWSALTSRNPHTAATGTVAKVLVLPWLMYLLVVLFIVLSARGGRPDPDFGPNSMIGLWLVLGLLTDLGFGLVCREKVLTEFREVATQRYSGRSGLWEKVTRPSPAGSAPASPADQVSG